MVSLGRNFQGSRFPSHQFGQAASSVSSKPVKPKRKLHRLRTIWKRYTEPRLIREGKADATFAAYRSHVGAWEKYWAELGSFDVQAKVAKSKAPSLCRNEGAFLPKKMKIPDPPVQRIKQKHLQSFADWLAANGKAQGTINNHLTSVKAILKDAAEKNKIESVPVMKRQVTKTAVEKIYLTHEHINSIYQASAIASWPVRQKIGGRIVGKLPYPPCDYWRAALVLYFNYGFRTQELIAYERQKQSLTWSNIVFQEESPGSSDAKSEYGWLYYVPQKQKGKKPDPLVLPLNQMAAEHLRAIRPPSFKPTDPLFPFPHSKHSFTSTWDRIVRKAKVKPKAALCGVPKQYLIKHLRKTCATFHNRNIRGIAPYILGHGNRNSVTDLHYDNPELATLDALMSLEQPESFLQVLRRDQLLLF